MNNNLDKMNEARLEKCLDEEFRFSDGIKTLRQHFEDHPPVYKTLYFQKYSRKKIGGCYKEFKTPKKIYTIWREDDLGTEVPKLVYDNIEVPDRSR